MKNTSFSRVNALKSERVEPIDENCGFIGKIFDDFLNEASNIYIKNVFQLDLASK
jgi:hypothetical protein